MTDSQVALLSVVALDAAVAGFVIGGFWLSVVLLRSFGNKVGYSLVPLGFSRPKGGILAGIGVGIAVGVFAVLLSIVVNPLSALVLDRLGYSTDSTLQRPFMQGLTAWVRESPGMAVPAIVLVVVIFGPAVEELVFRGVVFNGLYRLGTVISTRSRAEEGSISPSGRLLFVTSALASSVVFALLHQEPVLMPILLLLAMVLCALFQRTGSLLPSFVAHATFNSFATALIILSGLGVLDIPI
ncbi:MAG: CPBP family intramembrane metalloprotease [Rubrobacter sp.]|nr:CPBP family intramembrane metalloprotease [Rubrobacter sp.]